MNQSQFTAYVEGRKALGMNRTQISAELRIGRSTLFEYLNGNATIPRYLELLCQAVEAGLTQEGDK
jgi:transcriptional regulator with XRE-family HTH domain